MSLGLEHIILHELVYLPSSSSEEKKLLSMNRAFHYGGSYLDLWTLVRSGYAIKLVTFITS